MAWERVKLKRLFRIVNGSTPRSDEASYWNGDIVWVTPDDLGSLHSHQVGTSRRTLTDEGLANCGATLVPPGSLVLSTRAPIGHIGLATVELATNQGCRALVPGAGVDSSFYYYALIAARAELKVRGTGSTFLELSRDQLGEVAVPAPDLAEQRAIAAFLDRKTAKVDILVEKKDRLLNLLDEKRTALISHAVIRGLDPNAPTTDSGVKWLGEIPAHWETAKLKVVARVQTGLTLGKRYDEELVDVPYLRVANVQSGYIDIADLATISVPPDVVRRHALRKGDVLLTEGGDFDKLGRGYVWDASVEPCIHQNHVFAVRPQRERLSPVFLAWLTSSLYGRAYFTATSTQSTNLASTTATKVGNFPIPLPPKAEQMRIEEVVRRDLEAIQATEGSLKDAISLLQEYRTALISAAVNGQIDIPDVVI